jgi:hypothetical protein
VIGDNSAYVSYLLMERSVNAARMGAARVTLGHDGLPDFGWIFYRGGDFGSILATALLVVSVGLSLVVGVAASYWVVRMVLGAFGSRVGMPVVERARAAAAGD